MRSIAFLIISLCSNNIKTKITSVTKGATSILLPSPLRIMVTQWVSLWLMRPNSLFSKSHCYFMTLMFCFDGSREAYLHSCNTHNQIKQWHGLLLGSLMSLERRSCVLCSQQLVCPSSQGPTRGKNIVFIPLFYVLFLLGTFMTDYFQ